MPLVPDETALTPALAWGRPTRPLALHTARCIAAANAVSKLVTLPAPLLKHTPFLAGVVTLACAVHLAACSWLLSGDEGFLAKERIRLAVGALRSLAGVWGVAAEVLAQVKAVARDVFRLESDAGGGAGIVSEEEVLRYIADDAGAWAQGAWDGS